MKEGKVLIFIIHYTSSSKGLTSNTFFHLGLGVSLHGNHFPPFYLRGNKLTETK